MKENMKLRWLGLLSQSTALAEDSAGTPVAGYRILEDGGTTYDGVAAAPGTIEIFGREIHFSQTESNSAGSSPKWAFKNFTHAVESTYHTDTDYKFTIDVENTGTVEGTTHVPFMINGEVKFSDKITVGAGKMTTVVVYWSWKDMGQYTIGLGPTDEVTWFVWPSW